VKVEVALAEVKEHVKVQGTQFVLLTNTVEGALARLVRDLSPQLGLPCRLTYSTQPREASATDKLMAPLFFFTLRKEFRVTDIRTLIDSR